MSSERIRVALVGDGPTGESALRALAEHFDVVAVFRNAAPAPEADPVVALAGELGTPVLPAAQLRALEEGLRTAQPDVVVVSSYSRILPAHLVQQYALINVHYGALPAYRGRANVNWALINGETEVGVTIHSIAPGLDAGPILAQRLIPVGDRENVSDLYARLNAAQVQMLPDAVRARHRGEPGIVQDETQASYCCGRRPDDGLIDWAASTASIDRLVRALSPPYPGAFTFRGTVRILIDEACPAVDAPTYVGRVPGRIVRVDHASGEVDVLTGDGALRVQSVRVEGAAVRPAEVISSLSDTLGLFPLSFLREAGLIR